MKKTFFKPLIFLLTLALLLSALPTPVLAKETDSVNQIEGSLETNNIDITGDGSFASLLSNKLSEGDAETGENHISELSINNHTATVTYQTSSNADLVVAIYDENTEQMLASGTVSAPTEETKITVPIEGTIPASFIARAYLLDSTGHEPLCDSYTTQQYTHDMQELQAMTTEDFEEEFVLNLDDKIETNFGIYNSSTIQIQASSQKNVLTDNHDNSYTITNADETFTKLQTGDSFSYEYSNGTVILVKIASISINNDTVTIVSETDVDLSDFFDYIKIEADSYGCDFIIDDSTLDDGVTRISEEAEIMPLAIDADAKLSGSIPFTIKKDIVKSDSGKITIAGNLKFGFTTTLKYYLALKRQFISFKLESSLSAGFDISAKIDLVEIPLSRISYHILPAVEVGFTPAFVVEVSDKISWEGEVSSSITFSFDSENGGDFTHEGPTTKSEMKFEGKVFVGIQAEPYVAIISKDLGKASFKASGGIEASAKKVEVTTEDDFRHDCNNCLGGELYARLSGSFTISLIKGVVSEELKLTPFRSKVCDYYYSEDYHEFDFTTCPHFRYKVIINVKDDKNNPISGADINGTNLDYTPTTDENGTAIVYLPDGEYELSVQNNSYVGTETLTVNGGKKEATITITPNTQYRAIITVLDENNNPVSGAKILGSGLKEPPVTNDLGKAILSIKKGSYVLIAETDIYSGVSELIIEDRDVELAITVYPSIQNKVLSSGKFGVEGDNLEWVLYENGLLSITGIGEMEDWQGITIGPTNSWSPWNNWSDIITSVNITNGVTNIGSCAFKNCTNLTNVIIPESVINMGGSVFYGCSSLEKIELPTKIKNIPYCAFYDCSLLKIINIPENVNKIGNGAFTNCSNLASIKLPENITIIEPGTFEGCSSLINLTIPKNVTDIGTAAFSNSGLNNIYFFENAPSFGNRCFENIIATVYYPMNNNTWSSGWLGNMYDYGGKITWMPYSPDSITNTNESDQITNNIEKTDKTLSPKTEQIVEENHSTEITPKTTEISGPTEVLDPTEILNPTEVSEPTEVLESTEFLEPTEILDSTVISAGTPLPETNFIEITPVAMKYDLLKSTYTGTITSGEKKTAKFTGLVPHAAYILVVVKNLDTINLLSADNLLYIAQMNADENGYAAFTYIPRIDDKAEIRAYGAGHPDIPVSSIRVTPLSVQLSKGSTQQLTVTILPENASRKDVTFTSSNKAIATVSSTGLITGISKGTVTITISTIDGTITTTCSVVVSENHDSNSQDQNSNKSQGNTSDVTAVNAPTTGDQNMTEFFLILLSFACIGIFILTVITKHKNHRDKN